MSASHYGKGPDIATGPDGQVYVCWEDLCTGSSPSPPSHGVMFDKSTDGGQNFNGAVQAFPITGIDRNLLSNPQSQAEFGNTRVNDFPSIAVDLSNDAHRGRIYIAYADDHSGESYIEVSYSDDGGSTWQDVGSVDYAITDAQEWFPWIAMARSTGYVSVVFYAEDASFNTNTWVAYSFDDGQTFHDIKVSDVSHKTEPIDNSCSTCNFNTAYAGDYIGITAQGSSAWATWADQRNGIWQVYVSRVDYVTPPPLNVSISGPSSLAYGATWNYKADVSGGGPNYHYYWQYNYWCLGSGPSASPDKPPPGGGGNCGVWITGSTGINQEMLSQSQYGGVTLELKVTDDPGQSTTVYKEVQFVN